MRVSARTCNNGATPDKGGVLQVSGPVPKGYDEWPSEVWDYHEGDIPCFWQNLRTNAQKRLEAFMAQRAEGVKS
jgi:hypothetical protein